MLNPTAISPEFRDRVAPFLSAHGFGNDCRIEPVAGGGNNRVYRVKMGARTGLLKAYFQNPADSRDRFGGEQAFYTFLWGQGVRRTPEPLGWDEEQRLGLFTFVPGRKLRAEEITMDHVGQALAFIAELNQARTTTAAEQLPPASEACFSRAEHLACVEGRVARLAHIGSANPLEREAAAFVTGELQPAWQKVRAVMDGQSLVDEPLPRAQRGLSPSDFGYHNALLADDGRLLFFDFEYAGWDDPAKLVCDFFCQPQVPVPPGLRAEFLHRLALALELDSAFANRVRWLQPVYQIKWCCIMLNDFLVGDQARRDFAQGVADAGMRRRIQLEKARRSLRQFCDPAP